MDLSDTSDPKHNNYKCKEALQLVEVARAQSAVCRYEKELAHAQLKHSAALSNLYRCHSWEMQRRFDIAESHLGSVRNSIQMNRGTLCKSSLPMCRHQDSTSSIDQDTGMYFIQNLTVLISPSHYA